MGTRSRTGSVGLEDSTGSMGSSVGSESETSIFLGSSVSSVVSEMTFSVSGGFSSTEVASLEVSEVLSALEILLSIDFKALSLSIIQ